MFEDAAIHVITQEFAGIVTAHPEGSLREIIRPEGEKNPPPSRFHPR